MRHVKGIITMKPRKEVEHGTPDMDLFKDMPATGVCRKCHTHVQQGVVYCAGCRMK